MSLQEMGLVISGWLIRQKREDRIEMALSAVGLCHNLFAIRMKQFSRKVPLTTEIYITLEEIRVREEERLSVGSLSRLRKVPPPAGDTNTGRCRARVLALAQKRHGTVLMR